MQQRDKKQWIPLGLRHRSERIDVNELSQHLRRPAPTILSDRTRAPWRVPASCTPVGVRPVMWLVGTVLDFDLVQVEANIEAQRPAISRRVASAKGKVGRPNKVEQIRRRQECAR
jgi:hypothetical protein